LTGSPGNFPSLGIVAVGISVIALAVVLSLLVRALRRPLASGSRRRDHWRAVKQALLFLAGPFPISIAIHLAVLLFLIHEVGQVAVRKYISIHLEGGSGQAGAVTDSKLPKLPDVAMPDTAVTGLSFPAPRIATQKTITKSYTNDYVRAVNRGQYGNGFGGGSGHGADSGYGRAIGNGFGGFIGELRRRGLDVVLVIDGTGSMEFVMDEVKAKMSALVLAIHRLVPVARIGIVQFGGRGEQDQIQPFTTSSSQLEVFLHRIKAQNGSADWREDTLTAIKTAVLQMQWRPSAKKVIVLVGDTPPWEEDYAPIMNLISQFRNEDGTFNTVDVTREEHEMYERKELNLKTISPLPEFYLSTQHAYQEMAKVGGGQWGSLTKDSAINQQVLMLAFGRQWKSQIAAFQTDVANRIR
jgi:Mg-chelatase subunit ChlD